MDVCGGKRVREHARRCDGAQTKNLENLSSCETKIYLSHPDQEALHRFASRARW
jgi:hypothetical protein